MKMKTSRLIAAAAVAALLPLTPASAQVVQPELTVQPGNTVLSVNAEGSSMRRPDLALFTAGVTTQGQTAAAALAENSRSMAQVIAALKRAGIADRDIQTSNLSLNPVYSDPNRDAMIAARSGDRTSMPIPTEQQVPRIIGYQATNTVSVRQRQLEDYGRIIDTLVSAGANQVNGPVFQLDNEQTALDEARIDAMRNARRQAELYARAAGLNIVRTLSIGEGGGYSSPQPAFRMAEMAAPPPPPAPVQAGELDMRASVTVLYELAP
ncbi:SIMPL domain-containing protein [Altericroceibacterium xinjiangense]|uniref:SIMPL domain-containing protein n=1 Tax=Altericroceibacterium xinjiangense TaxID=762261 RepID=UPI001F49B471|nr:SIMPL domain-containing protein [Altericroceibacterium xinjiangense]